MKKSKLFAPFLMLLAAAIAAGEVAVTLVSLTLTFSKWISHLALLILETPVIFRVVDKAA